MAKVHHKRRGSDLPGALQASEAGLVSRFAHARSERLQEEVRVRVPEFLPDLLQLTSGRVQPEIFALGF